MGVAEWTCAPGSLPRRLALAYITLGALIGLIGFYNRVPLFNFNLAAWRLVRYVD